MSAGTFTSLYASTYDALYRDKDYEREVRLVDELLREHSSRDVRSVLDLGCGTGNHALHLSRLGYDVACVERSPAMLELARRKLAGSHNVELHEGDIRDLDLGRVVDAALILFAVLSYQTEDDDVLAALRSVRRHLLPGGLLVFDVWYGPAVLHQRPEERVARIPLERGELVRSVVPELDESRHLCRLRYELQHVDGGRVLDAATEEHLVRFFFADELRRLLAESGFELVRLSAFPELGRPPSESTWSVAAVAEAR